MYLCVSQTSREGALRVPPAFVGRRKEGSDELDGVALQNEQLKAFLKDVQNKAPRYNASTYPLVRWQRGFYVNALRCNLSGAYLY